jgi:hypothetical protein
MSVSTKPIAGRVRKTYEFIKAHRREFGAQRMCRLLEVAPSGFFEWLKQPMSNRAQEDARLLRLIRASFEASQGVYGAPRVFLDLREAGETCGSTESRGSCARTTCVPCMATAPGAGRSASQRSWFRTS